MRTTDLAAFGPALADRAARLALGRLVASFIPADEKRPRKATRARFDAAKEVGADRAALARALSAWDLEREDALECVQAVAALVEEGGR